MGETGSRLRRRWASMRSGRVARVAVAYAAAGWLLVQVASTMLVPLGLPDWALRFFIVLVIGGLFVAIAIAWGFGSDPATGPDGHPAAAMGAPATPPSPADRTQADPSIAVLAFADMSPNRDQGYLCEGTAEEIINSLTSVRGLRVASRSGSFQFKDRAIDNRDVARLLSVRTVLDGSVRKAGDRVRIAAQLVDAQGATLWAETFDRRFEDIFAIQEEIARATVRALRVTLLSGDEARLGRRGTGSLPAYELLLRGRQLMRREKGVEQRAAAHFFREAAGIDPQFAEAHAALASVLAHMQHRRLDPAELEEARSASLRALELEPGLVAAHVARGQMLEVDGRSPDAAAAFERAIALDPRSFDAHYYYARYLVAQGDHAGAARHYEQAFALHPDDYMPMTLAIQEYTALGDRDGAADAARRSWAGIEKRLAADPDDSAAYDHGSGVLALLGRLDDARRFRARALALRPDDPMTHYNSACSAMLAGDHDVALALLERAIELGYSDAKWIANDTDFVPLRDDPRFKALLAKLSG